MNWYEDIVIYWKRTRVCLLHWLKTLWLWREPSRTQRFFTRLTLSVASATIIIETPPSLFNLVIVCVPYARDIFSAMLPISYELAVFSITPLFIPDRYGPNAKGHVSRDGPYASWLIVQVEPVSILNEILEGTRPKSEQNANQSSYQIQKRNTEFCFNWTLHASLSFPNLGKNVP